MRLRSEASNLAECVNPRVCSPCCMQNDVFLRQAAQHFNDFSLNRGLAGLNLPAVEIGAVVRDGELEIAHGKKVISFQPSVFRGGIKSGKFPASAQEPYGQSGFQASLPRCRRGRAGNLLPRSWRWAIGSATALLLR